MINITNALIDQFICKALMASRRDRVEARYLEIGCGELRYARYLEGNGWHCVFTDYEVRSLGVSVLADAHQLPFSDGMFDVVLMTEVLEHLHSPEIALDEISRVMSAGGTLIITSPFNYALHEMPHDYTRWTEFHLQANLRRRSFEIKHFQRRGDAIAVVLTIMSHLVAGALYSLSRHLPGRPSSQKIASVLMWAPTKLYLALRTRWPTPIFTEAGDGLSGANGHLQLWNLGYHVICQKG